VKNDNVISVTSGASTTYIITVTNNGPSSVTGAILSDPPVAGLSKTAVVCSAAPGQCRSGFIPTPYQLERGLFALPTLAAGQWYEISVSATVIATSGSLINTATVATPSGVTEPQPGQQHRR